MISNYLSHLNGYRERRKVEPLTTNEIALYFILLEYCNGLGWLEWFTAANGVIQGLSGLSLPAFKRARGELTRKGYVRYKLGSGNQAGRYLIVSFEPQTEPQTELQSVPQISHKVNPLNKQKQRLKQYGTRNAKEEPKASYDLAAFETMLNQPIFEQEV